MNHVKLEKIPHWFSTGEILKNNNNSLYKVIDASFQLAVVFEHVSDGYQLIAHLPKMYIRTNEDDTKGTVLEWSCSKEIGWKSDPGLLLDKKGPPIKGGHVKKPLAKFTRAVYNTHVE